MAQNRVFKLTGRYDIYDGCTVRIRPAHPARKDGDWEVEIRPKRCRRTYTVLLSRLVRYGLMSVVQEECGRGPRGEQPVKLS